MAECTCQKDWLPKMFGDPKYSDFTIECGPSTWHVHRVVVCAQSTFFDKACSNGFKETSSKIVKLEDDDPLIVREMLRYLYTGDYQDQTKEAKEKGVHTALATSVLVHTIADKYDIPTLAKAAIAKFQTRAAKEWKTERFADVIEDLYAEDDGTKESMQKIVVETAAEHAKQLLTDHCGIAFREVAMRVPRFSTELSIRIINMRLVAMPSYTRYRCPNSHCNKVNVLETLTPSSSNTRCCNYCTSRHYLNIWIGKVIEE